MGRFVAVFTVLLVIAAGCSGSDGDPALDAASDGATSGVDVSSVLDEATVAAIEGFIELLGPEAAFRGVLFAFDNGYDVGQVTAGMGDGSLDGNGVIAGVEPAGATVGLIDRSGPSAHGAVIVAAGPVIVVGAGPVTADEFKQGLFEAASAMLFSLDLAAERERQGLSNEASQVLIATIISLTSAGYSLEQIIDYVVFGEDAVEIPMGNEDGCWVVVDAKRLSVAPANEALTGPCGPVYEDLRKLERLAAGALDTPSSTTTQTDAEAPSAVGSITGVVLDIGTGAGVPGATVTVAPGGVTATTDADGVFTFGEVEPGAYTITVIAEGFPEAAAGVDVEAGETADTTIGLEKDDQLPWVFEGTGEAVLTAADPFGSGAPFVITSLVQVTITLNADGTAVFARVFPDTYGSLTVDCVDRTAHVSTRSGLPPITTVGTHAGGEFELPWGSEGATITGTYSSTEIQGRWGYETLTGWCDDITGKLWNPEFGFGPEGMARVHDTP